MLPLRLELLSKNCFGFERAVDPSSEAYRKFMRVMNKRNFIIHGNVDPIREQIEIVYFDEKRPLFTEHGDHVLKAFEHMEDINKSDDVLGDYECVHTFLHEIKTMLAPSYRDFFDHVIGDPYPGYEVKLKRVTKILPDHTISMLMQGVRYDDELEVIW